MCSSASHVVVYCILLCLQVAHDVVTEFAEDGVVYLELRSTPRANPKTGATGFAAAIPYLVWTQTGLNPCILK